MAINLNVQGNTQPLEAAVQAAVNRIRKTPIKITVDDKGATQPLGNMKRGADEFSKSMEAANARIIAFGASMAIINGVSDAFKAMVKNVVEVEKALADINVVMGLSATNLDKFSSGLFKVAKETAASFDVAAAAATEYARQGLKVEETLKRTKDALILTRLTGMDSANAVKALTAAMNTYGDQIKDTTQLVSKFAAVDVQFAVSAEDFADAISRTGQAAKSAGVDIDELVGLVTAAQQQTARGGKVIGNSFKTIFTRIGRTDTLNQLENLGIAVRDVEGRTLGAKRILTDLANTFDHLSEAQKAQIAQTVGGVFQINVLKAVLSDAAKQNGILANATQISAGATDEAITKNEQLRQTMAAMASETGLALKEVSAQIGEIMLAPGMEKILNIVKSMTEGVGDMLGTGEGAGNTFAKGFLKGLGNIITGPGLVVMVAVFTKLLIKAVQYARDSLKSLIGVTSEAQKQKAIQTSLVTLFGQNAALNKEMLRTDISRTEKEKIILSLLKAQVMEANALNSLTKQMSTTLYSKGYGANLAPRRGKAGGHIPNFADPERQQAARGGYAAGTIRSMNIPGEGSVIYNSAEKVKNFKGMSQPAIMPPHSSKAGKNYQQAFGSIHGFDPYAAIGYVPNFAKTSAEHLKNALGAKRTTNLTNIARGATIGGVTFSQKQRDIAATELQRRASASSKTSTSKTSQLSPKGVKYLNPNSINYIGLSASLGPDIPKASYYVAGGTQTSSGIYSSATAKGFNDSLKKGVPGAKIDVEFKALDSSDKQKAFGKMDDEINSDLQNNSQIIANKILSRFDKAPMKKGDIGKDLPKNKMSVVSGHIFEAVTKSVLRQVGAEGAIADGPNDLIDLGYNKELYELFGIKEGEKKGQSGAEAKLNTTEKNVKSLARKIYSLHTGSHLKTKGKTAASGYIPNFANPLSDAIGREKAAGVPVSQIRVGSHPALMNKSNPIGLGVTNTQDEPNGLRDVFGAANGYVPNYAPPQISASDITGYRGRSAQAQMDENAKKYNEVLKRSINAFKEGHISKKKLNQRIKDLGQRYHVSTQAQQNVEVELKKSTASIKNLNTARKRASNILSSSYSSARGGVSALNTKFGNTALGKGLGSTGGQMGLMMGAPMLAGLLQGEGPGKVSDTQYQAGGALMGVGTGAAMGMMFGPLGAAIGGVIGGFSGLLSASEDLKEAQEKAAKAAIESSVQTGAALAQSLAPSLTKTDFGKSGEVEFSFGGRRQKIDVDNFNKLSAKDPSKGGGFGMEMGADLRGKMLGSLDLDMKDILRRGAGSPSAISNLLKESGINVSREQIDRAVYTGKMIRGEDQGDVTQVRERRGSEEQIKKIEDQILAQMGSAARPEAIKAALDQLPKDMKIQTAALKEGSTARGRAFKKGDLEYFTPEELKKQIDEGNITQVAKAYADILKQVEEQRDLNTKQNEAVILQLNAQRAIVTAQQQARDMQFDIKSSYAKIGSSLSLQAKIMGNFATEQQKAQLDYTKAINKAAESYAAGTLSERDKYRQGMLAFSKEDNIASALKTSLARKNLVEQAERSGDLAGQFPKDPAIEEKAKQIDLTSELIKLSNEELYAELKKANLNTTQLQTLQDYKNSKEKNIEMLLKELNLSSKIAQNEFKINDAIAKRKDIVSSMQFGSEMMSQTIGYQKSMRGLETQVGAARRLTDLAPGYQSKAAREDFQMAEKRIELEEKIKNIKGDAQVLLSQERSKMADILLQNKQLGDLKKKSESGETMTIQEVLAMESLVQTTDKRSMALLKVEDSMDKIDKKSKKEISTAETLLMLEEKRLQAKRLHETGPGAFTSGLKDSADEMRDRVQYMDYELGKNIPMKFADGLAQAMQATLNQTENLGDALMGIASNFLQAIQSALLQKAAYQIVGGVGASTGLFSKGGGVRNYSRGGGVPAMVTNGEYVMSRDAVSKYGGAFMHSLNAGGKIPGYANGGAAPGSAIAENFGGGRGFASGRAYQSKAMSSFFYTQSQNVGLKEDEQALMGVLQEEERKRQEAAAKKAKKKAFLQQLLGTALSAGLTAGLTNAIKGGDLTKSAISKGYTDATPKGALSGFNTKTGMRASFAPGSEIGENWITQPVRQSAFSKYNPFNWGMKPQQGPGFASGGHVSGKSGIDQIPAMLSEGEYVIKASSARQLGKPMLDRINAGKYNDGGPVGSTQIDSSTSGGNTNNISISINMEKGQVSSEEKNQDSNPATSQEGGSEKDQAVLAEKIKQQVVSVIVEEQRPGGLLSE